MWCSWENGPGTALGRIRTHQSRPIEIKKWRASVTGSSTQHPSVTPVWFRGWELVLTNRLGSAVPPVLRHQQHWSPHLLPSATLVSVSLRYSDVCPPQGLCTSCSFFGIFFLDVGGGSSLPVGGHSRLIREDLPGFLWEVSGAPRRPALLLPRTAVCRGIFLAARFLSRWNDSAVLAGSFSVLVPQETFTA